MDNSTPHNHNKIFTGTINQLLEAASKIDVANLEEQLTLDEVPLTNEENIEHLMAEYQLSREDATYIYEQMKLELVKETCEKLVNEGLIEVSEYGEDGEPKYRCTELGHKLVKDIEGKK